MSFCCFSTASLFSSYCSGLWQQRKTYENYVLEWNFNLSAVVVDSTQLVWGQRRQGNLKERTYWMDRKLTSTLKFKLKTKIITMMMMLSRRAIHRCCRDQRLGIRVIEAPRQSGPAAVARTKYSRSMCSSSYYHGRWLAWRDDCDSIVADARRWKMSLYWRWWSVAWE